MPKKESLEDFTKNFGRYPDKVKREAMGTWNANTLLAMVEAQKRSPVDKGTLQGSARRVKAKVGRDGITSAFIFGVPYAFKLEKGISEREFDNGNISVRKTININTSINPQAQSGYAKAGVEVQEPFFIRDLKKVIGKAFNRV